MSVPARRIGPGPWVLALIAGIWLASALALAVGYSGSLFVLGTTVAPFIIFAFLKPGVVTTAIPVLWVVSSYPSPLWKYAAATILGVAFLGGWFRASGDRRKWALFPLIGVGLVVLREFADSANSSISDWRLYSILGLLSGAACTLSPPKRQSFLALVGVAGVYFTLQSFNSGLSAENRGAIDVLGVNANGVSFAAGLGFLALLVLAVGDLQRRWIPVIAVGLATCGAGLLAGGSQGALLATGAGIVSVVAVRIGWFRATPPAVILGAAMLTAYNWLRTGPLVAWFRADLVLEQSRQSRIELAAVAWQVFLRSPLIGSGNAGANLDVGSAQYISPHNLYLRILIVGGIIMFAALVGWVVLVLVRRGNVEDRNQYLPLIVAFGVFGLGAEWHDFPTGLTFGAVVGALAAFPRDSRRSGTVSSQVPRHPASDSWPPPRISLP